MFADLLVHRLQVYARSGKRDRFGQRADTNPTELTGDPVATYNCRAYMKAGGLEMEERNIDVFSRVWRVFLEPTADVYEDDACKVIDVDGTVLVATAKVRDIQPKHDSLGVHHIELDLWEHAGPNPRRPA